MNVCLNNYIRFFTTFSSVFVKTNKERAQGGLGFYDNQFLQRRRDGSDSGAHGSKNRFDQWQSGELVTGSRVQSFPCAFDTALSLLHLAGAEKTSPLPSPPPDILLADSLTIPFSLTELP